MSKPDFTKEFYQAVESRNTEQQSAIRQIEGPVLVLAGPGTGKTEVLSLRIGNILQETDTEPHHILCLTYTESGALAMRARLTKHIGPAAYNVHIHTFHAFCNMVIQENPQHFGFYRELQPLSDLERVELLMEIIDGLPHEHVLRRLKGDMYYESKRMGNLFDLMKKENWSPQHITMAIESYIKEARDSDEFIAKRKAGRYQKGDFREDWFNEKVIGKMDLVQSAVDLFHTYQAKMRSVDRYDFNDMLRWVYDAFGKDPDLLATYQEKFLYVLVDEFQDTNGLQLDILRQLLSYWEDQPNIFIVGDDDQSIYRFQGANVENIDAFLKHYLPETVVLTKNYRSTQYILNAASDLIAHNKERIIHRIQGLSKDLIASAVWAESPDKVKIVEYETNRHEQSSLASRLKNLYESGSLTRESVAVIYRKHKQAEDLVKVLENLGVPVELKRKVNILNEPFIWNIILVIRYFWENYRRSPNVQNTLYRMMHFRYFQIDPRDVAILAVHALPESREEPRKNVRDLLDNAELYKTLELHDPARLRHFSDFLLKTEKELFEDTFQVFFEKLLTRSGILQFMYTSPERRYLFQVITSMFDLIKQESEKNPRFSFEEFLEMISKLELHNIPVSATRITKQESGVQFLTAHSAKGLEFDRVFMIDCLENNWEKQRTSQNEFSLPPTLVPATKIFSEEDERRLFYVAMTRAKKELEISFGRFNEEGREYSRSKFVEELLSGGNAVFQRTGSDGDAMIDFLFERFRVKPEESVELLDHELIDLRLEGFELSVTAVNKYLECPRKFYFENILRIPAARNVNMGFGSAIHRALEQFFNQFYEGRKDALSYLLESFEQAMQYYKSHFTEIEFENRLVYGKQVLTDYYDQYNTEWQKPQELHQEYKIKNVEYRGVPLTGFLDKIEVFGDGVVVTDYKTGKFRSEKFQRPSEKSEYGGDYWRQIVYYHLLIDIDPRQHWHMKRGVVEFIEPGSNGKYYRKHIDVTPEDINILSSQIETVYEAIRAHRFEEGCEECYWCQLVQAEFKPTVTPNAEVADVDYEGM